MCKNLLYSVFPLASVVDLVWQVKSSVNEYSRAEVRGEDWIIVPQRDDDGEDEIPA